MGPGADLDVHICPAVDVVVTETNRCKLDGAAGLRKVSVKGLALHAGAGVVVVAHAVPVDVGGAAGNGDREIVRCRLTQTEIAHDFQFHWTRLKRVDMRFQLCRGERPCVGCLGWVGWRLVAERHGRGASLAVVRGGVGEAQAIHPGHKGGNVGNVVGAVRGRATLSTIVPDLAVRTAGILIIVIRMT